MPSIKVLAISPYPGMVPLLTETAKEYDGLELTISVGDLAKGDVYKRQAQGHKDF